MRYCKQMTAFSRRLHCLSTSQNFCCHGAHSPRHTITSNPILTEQHKAFTLSVLNSRSFSATPPTIPPPDLGHGYLPPPPDTTMLGGGEEVLTSLGEPTLASLGLCNHTPPGLVQYLLEKIHITADIPWVGSIIALTLTVRFLALPLTVMQLKASALMHNHMPTLQKLQTNMVQAKVDGDPHKIMKAIEEFKGYQKRNNISQFGLMLRPLCMAPVFFSVFYGIRGMTELPVQSLETGGALWFPDLTLADPYFILPAASALTVYLVTKTGAEGSSLDTLPPVMRTFFKVMPFMVFGFIAYHPSALALYWTTSNILSLGFAHTFNKPAMARALGIPERVKHPKDDDKDPFKSMMDIIQRRKGGPAQPQTGNMANMTFKEKMQHYEKAVYLQHEMEQRERAQKKLGQIDESKGWSEPHTIKLGMKKQDVEGNSQMSQDDKLVSDSELGQAQDQLKSDKKD